MSHKNDPHAGHRPGSFMEAVSWLNRSAWGERLSCYSLREAVAKVVEREVYLRRGIERLETERDSLRSQLAALSHIGTGAGRRAMPEERP